MKIIEDLYGFKASERKWKEKLKEWGFDKNLSAENMKKIVAKGEKRARDDGKDTVFFLQGSEITKARIENFKKRRIPNTEDVVSPSAETPANVTYYTPQPEVEHPSPVNHEEVGDFKIPRNGSSSALPGYPQVLSFREDRAAAYIASNELNWQALSDGVAEDTVDENAASSKAHFPTFDASSLALPDLFLTGYMLEGLVIHKSVDRLRYIGPHLAGEDLDDTDTDWVRHMKPCPYLPTRPSQNQSNTRLSRKPRMQSPASYSDQSSRKAKSRRLPVRVLSLIVLAETYKNQHQQDRPIKAYRRLFAVEEATYHIEKFRSTAAERYDSNHELDVVQAQFFALKAIASFKDLPIEDKLLEYQCLLGQHLIQHDHPDDERRLLSALADSLNQDSIPEMKSALKSLRSIAPPAQNSEELSPKLTAMLEILESVGQTNYFSCPGFICQVSRIASLYSSKQSLQSGKHNCVGQLIASAEMQINHPSNKKGGIVLARVYFEFALLHEQRHNWGEYTSYLRKASLIMDVKYTHETLHRIVVYSDWTGAIEGQSHFDARIVKDHLAQLKSLLEAAISRDEAVVLTTPSKLKLPNEHHDREGHLETRSISTSVSSRSHRYGITYSVSSVAGISDLVSRYI